MSATTAPVARPVARDSKKPGSGAKTHPDGHRSEQAERRQAASNNMNQEQLRIASLMNEKSDCTDIETKVEKVIELTKASKDAAVVALHDCDYDLNRAVSKILEGDSDDNWTSVSKNKKEKDKPPAKNQVADTAVKQSNGTSTKAAPVANRNRPAGAPVPGRRERPAGDRQNRPPRSREETHPNSRDSAVAGDRGSDHPPEGRMRAPRVPRPPREGGNRPERTGPAGERRPDGVRRSDPTGASAGGGTASRPRGPRTFSSQQKPVPPPAPSDDFANSIDTWTNTTADPNAPPAPTPITSMTVGNWSDVVSGANEDWSEEDYESSLMETKVFVPSGKPLPEKDEVVQQTTHVQKRGPGPQPAPAQLDRKEAAGAQILQSLKQPVSQGGYGQISQSYINKQAAESIKSLVGIPTAAYPATAAAPSAHHHADPKPAAPSGRPVNQSQTRRVTRIPESAVEMPSNDSVTSLKVQFGALDVNFAAADSQSYVKSDVQPLNHKTVNTSFEQQAKSVLPDDMMKRHEVLSGKAEQAVDPRNAVAKHVKSAIDSVKGPDLYSVTGSQSDYKGSASFGSSGSYSAYSGIASTSGQFNAYANPSTYASSYSTNYQPAGQKSMSSNLKDIDNSGHQKHASYDMQSSAGLVNSTQTTNVLKNSLSATGKGNIGNPNMPRMLTQLMHPSYIMGGMASPAFYPVYDPSLQMNPTAAPDASGYAAAYNQTADTSKFARSDGVSDVASGGSSGVSSQAPVVSQHSQQQFISTLPPGYGFYYMPSAPGLFPPQGGPFVPVPPASNAHASAAPGFTKGNYASHSYGGGGYDTTGMQMQPDYVKAQAYGSQHQAKSMPSSDLMGQPSSYNKPHGSKPYEKMNYPSVGPGASAAAAYSLSGSQAALSASAYNSYMVPANMNQGFTDSAQSQAGRPPGSKGPTTGAPKNYGQNLYQSPSW